MHNDACYHCSTLLNLTLTISIKYHIFTLVLADELDVRLSSYDKYIEYKI